MEILQDYQGIIIGGIIILALIIIYNLMLVKKNKVKTAFSSMDVILKKRYDVMPNLVSMVQKYMEHESGVLTELTRIRENIDTTKDINESIELNKRIDNEIRRVRLAVENYPDLKASNNFLHMQATLNDIEEQISAARRTYNAHVEVYNTFIGMIPLNIFAFIFMFRKFEQFEITNEERESKIWM